MESAEKLLARMRNSKGGWKPRDFKCLYEGFGFELEEGSSHTIYVHPEYGLRATVARHKSLATGYAATAVKLIDALKAKEAELDEQEGAANDDRSKTD